VPSPDSGERRVVRTVPCVSVFFDVLIQGFQMLSDETNPLHMIRVSDIEIRRTFDFCLWFIIPIKLTARVCGGGAPRDRSITEEWFVASGSFRAERKM
jgi:hypothetical protein